MIDTEKELLCKDCVFSFMKNVFSDDDFCSIEQNRGEMTFSKDNIILKQGSFVSQILYLKTGLVKVVLEGKNDRNTILKIVEGKNFIALPVLGNPEMYPFSVVALTDCAICVIRKETMQDIVKQNEKVNSFLLNYYSTEYLYLYNRISVLSTRNNHGKLSSALWYLTQGIFKTNVLEYLSRKDLSELASISLESTNKILMELKNDKLISIENNCITILEPKLIKKLSTVG